MKERGEERRGRKTDFTKERDLESKIPILSLFLASLPFQLHAHPFPLHHSHSTSWLQVSSFFFPPPSSFILLLSPPSSFILLLLSSLTLNKIVKFRRKGKNIEPSGNDRRYLTAGGLLLKERFFLYDSSLFSLSLCESLPLSQCESLSSLLFL